MNYVTTVIKSRRSIRKYKTNPVEEEIVHVALECAHLAPTAKNEQPWLFGTVTDPGMLREIADLADNGKFIAHAQVCFAVFGKKDATYYLEDCCAATTQLILALQSFGVGSCWVAGDKKAFAKEVRTLLNVPESYTLVALVPAGYPETVEKVQKLPLEEITFENTWDGVT